MVKKIFHSHYRINSQITWARLSAYSYLAEIQHYYGEEAMEQGEERMRLVKIEEKCHYNRTSKMWVLTLTAYFMTDKEIIPL